jgi:hypothetical protein
VQLPNCKRIDKICSSISRNCFNLKQFPHLNKVEIELTGTAQVLCARIVRNKQKTGLGQTQNSLVNAFQQNLNRTDPDDLEQVEIKKSWFYIGSANLSPSAW